MLKRFCYTVVVLSTCGCGIFQCSQWKTQDSPERSPVVAKPVVDTVIIKEFSMDKLDSAIVYCWCFYDSVSTCFTVRNMLPEEICKEKNELIVVNDSTQLDSLRDLINSAETIGNDFHAIPDARIVMKLFHEDSTYLLTYRHDYTLVIDKNRILACNQKIVPWMKRVFNMKRIICSD